MSVELVILGFLREKEYHGYELKKEIQRRMGQWTDIKFGSIYHALRKLVERGAVQKVGEEHRRGKPDRTIYRITGKGEEEFLALLRELLNRLQRVYLEFDIGLYFAGNLPPVELPKILESRIAEHKEILRILKAVKEMPIHQQLPKVSELIIDHSIYHVEVEVKWLKEVLKRQQTEKLY